MEGLDHGDSRFATRGLRDDEEKRSGYPTIKHQRVPQLP